MLYAITRATGKLRIVIMFLKKIFFIIIMFNY